MGRSREYTSRGTASPFANPSTVQGRYEPAQDEDELYGLRPDQVLQHVAVKIERLHIKTDRLSRIRSLFEAQSQRLLRGMAQTVEAAQERVSLAFHRASDAQV